LERPTVTAGLEAVLVLEHNGLFVIVCKAVIESGCGPNGWSDSPRNEQPGPALRGSKDPAVAVQSSPLSGPMWIFLSNGIRACRDDNGLPTESTASFSTPRFTHLNVIQ
jgi:hypothetical protein